MPNIRIAQVREAIEIIAAEFGSLETIEHVFSRRQFFSSKDHFLQKAGVDRNAGKKEIRFLEIDYLRFEDDPTEGFDDCPVKNITLNLHLFREFAERSDLSNSSDEFIDATLELSNHVLENRDFDLPVSGLRITLDPIAQPEFAQFGADTFTDCKGHFTDLTLTVAFYDETEQ